MSKKKKKAVKKVSLQQSSRGTVKAGIEALSEHPWAVAIGVLVVLFSVLYSSSFWATTFLLKENSILKNPLLSHAGNIPAIFSKDFLLFTSGQFRPLSYALLAVVRSIIPTDNLLFWHMWLLGFHAANSLLVFALIRQFTPRLLPALVGTSAFALHPLGSVLVNDINQFYMLAGLTLCLGILNLYFYFIRSGNRLFYWLALVAYLTALFTARIAYATVLLLFLYELLYARNHLKFILVRLVPFVSFPFLFAPYLFMASPHPLHFKYVQMHEDSFWHGFFTVTGATGIFANGIVSTLNVPVILHETVQQIYSWTNPKFLFWCSVNLIVFGFALIAISRKYWTFFGILIVFIGVIPYASVAYNRVVEYVSWTYLYFPLAGFCLFLGGLFEKTQQISHRFIKLGVQAIFILLLLFWGVRTSQLNRYSQSPFEYWDYVYELNPSSASVLYEIGKAHLKQGQHNYAAHYFFSPTAKDLKDRCLAMAEYYCKEGEYLAAAIHLRFGSGKEATGVVLEKQCLVASELFLETGALDHAEENVGKVLMVNSYNTEAMCRLAHIWFVKGFVGEAKRMLDQVRTISPNNDDVRETERKFERLEREWQKSKEQLQVTPLPPDWLNYVLDQARTPELRKQIIELSYRADPNDAVIQLEAMVSLLENGNYREAAHKSKLVYKCLKGFPFACAVVCEALARDGQVENAIEAGLRAVMLDNTSTLAWRCLAIAYAQQEETENLDPSFVKNIERNSSLASMFYYNLGLQRSQKNRLQEAAALFEKSVKAQPDHVDALQAYGKTLYNLGKLNKAIEILRSGLAIKPDEPELQLYLGRAYLDMDQYATAEKALRSAVKINPTNAMYHFHLGASMEKQKNYKEAENCYCRAVELNPRYHIAHFQLGNCLYHLGKLDDALEEYHKVIEIDSSYHFVHLNMATIYQQQGQYAKAIYEYREEIRHSPQLKEPYQRLILVYCKKKDKKRAQATVDEAVRAGIQLDAEVLAEVKKIE